LGGSEAPQELSKVSLLLFLLYLVLVLVLGFQTIKRTAIIENEDEFEDDNGRLL